MGLLTVAVWVTTMSVAATYLAAQIALMLWDTNHREPWKIMGYIERGSTWVLLGVSGLIFLVHTYCFITWIRRLRKDRKDKGLSERDMVFMAIRWIRKLWKVKKDKMVLRDECEAESQNALVKESVFVFVLIYNTQLIKQAVMCGTLVVLPCGISDLLSCAA
ncbi:hypothetical protein LguiA_005295 [Lonicera macranthoides]